MLFKGISKEFSLLKEDQYNTIGAFWDEMSLLYGLENLQGVIVPHAEHTFIPIYTELLDMAFTDEAAAKMLPWMMYFDFSGFLFPIINLVYSCVYDSLLLLCCIIFAVLRKVSVSSCLRDFLLVFFNSYVYKMIKLILKSFKALRRVKFLFHFSNSPE